MSARVVFASGPLTGSSFAVGEQPLEVGRAADADIHVRDRLVARRHLRLFRNSGRLFVQWLGSVNGVYVNGARIAIGPVALVDGDCVSFGGSSFVVTLP